MMKSIVHTIFHKLNLNSPRLWFFLVIVLVFLGTFFYYIVHPALKASANWFDDNWQYRTPYTITNSGGDQTDKRIKIDIDTATLITNGKMQTECQDSRFMDATGKPLKFFIENGATLGTYVSQTTAKSTASTSTMSFSHTVSSGNNRMLVVLVHAMFTHNTGNNSDRDFAVSNLTYNGVNLSRQVYAIDRTTNRNYNSEIWTLLAPDTGTNTLSVSFQGPNNNPQDVVVEAMNFTGIDQFDPIGGRNWNLINSGATSTSVSTTVTTESPNSIIVAGGHIGNLNSGTVSLGTGTTSTFSDNTGLADSTAISAGGGYQTAPTAGANTVTINSDQNTSYIDVVALELKGDRGKASNIALSSKSISATTAGVGSISLSHTVSSGTNPLLAVVVHAMRSASGADSTDIDVGSVTFDGTALTRNVLADSSNTNRRLLTEIWTSTAPSVGTKTLSLNFIGATPTRQVVSVYSFTGVDRTAAGIGSSASTSANNNDSSISGQVSTLYDDSIILSGAMARSNDSNYDTLYMTQGAMYNQWFTNIGLTNPVVPNTIEFSFSDGIIVAENSDDPLMQFNMLNGETSATMNMVSLELHTAQSVAPSGTSHCNDASSDYYILLPSLPSGDSTIYHYYGNPTALPSFDLTQFSQSEASSYSTSAGSEANSPGPVGYWKFDEGFGTTTQDSTGNNNDGTLTNGPSWKTGDECIAGNCLYFDGTNDRVVITDPSNGSLDPTTAMTISAWIRPNTEGLNDFGRIMSEIADVDMFVQDDADGLVDVCAQTSGVTNTCATNSVTLNQWTHVAIVYTDNNTRQFYLNGRLITSNDSTNSLTNSSSNKIIGDNISSNSPFKGFIDEVKVYKYARSADQIKQESLQGGQNSGAAAAVINRNQSGNNLANGLIGYWKLDEVSGGATDSSGNNVTLTNNNSTPYNGGKFGNATTFNGSNRYLSAGSTVPSVQTVSFWAKPSVTTDNYVHLASGAYINSSSGTIAATGFTSPTMYVNGAQSSTIAANSWQLVTVTTNTPISASVFEVGRANGAYAGNNSQIDDVRLYNRALSSDEVRALYNWAPPPVIYYNFDEHTGTTSVNDISGNGYTGTLTGVVASSWIKGKYGSGIELDGSTRYITSTTEDAAVSTNSYTLSAWIKRSSDSGAAEIIVDNRDGANDGQLLQINSSDKLECYYNATTSVSVTSVTVNTWYHVSCVSNGSTQYLFVNGSLEDSDSLSGSISESTDVRIGARSFTSAASFFPGIIDDVRIYTYARSPGQVVEDMNGGHPLGGSPVGSQVGYWKFEEGQGTIANDQTDNNNDLTLSTARWTKNGKFGTAWDGSGAYLSRADDPDFDFDGSEDMTLSAWVKSDSATNPGAAEYIMNKSTATLPGYRLNFDTAGTISFLLDDDTTFNDFTLTTTSDLYDGSWHYIAAVKTGFSKAELYVDGKRDAYSTSSIPSGTMSNNQSFYVGDFDGIVNNTNFNGDIDEAKVYRAALTADQIRVDYNQGKALVLGSSSTDSTGVADNSASREYCVPGDSTSCSTPAFELKLDERTGTTVVSDTSGVGLTGNMASFSAASWVPGKKGSALNFDGVNNWLDFDDGSSNNLDMLDGSNFTIEFWMNRSSFTTDDTIIAKKNDQTSGTAGYVVWVDDSTDDIRLEVADGDGANTLTIDGTSTFTSAGWNHVAIVYDDSSATASKIYVNGVDDSAGSTLTGTFTSIGSLANAVDFRVGSESDNGSPFDGKIDDVKMYTYARTSAQVAWDYNKGAPFAFYKFDECQSTTANNSASNGNGTNMGLSGTISAGTVGTNTVIGTCNGGTGMWGNGASGKINYSLDFDGSDDVITVSDSSVLRPGNGSWSIAVWAKPDNINQTGVIIGKSQGTGNFEEYEMMITGGVTANSTGKKLQVAYRESETVERREASTDDVVDGNWHLYAFVANKTLDSLTLYKDGVQLSTTADVADGGWPTIDNTPNLLIGNQYSGSTRFFTGQIDEVKIFNYPLTGNQMKQLYNNGSVYFQ